MPEPSERRRALADRPGARENPSPVSAAELPTLRERNRQRLAERDPESGNIRRFFEAMVIRPRILIQPQTSASKTFGSYRRIGLYAGQRVQMFQFSVARYARVRGIPAPARKAFVSSNR